MSVFKYYDWTKSAAASASANDEKEKTMTYAEYKAKRNSASQNSAQGSSPTMTYTEFKARQARNSAGWFDSQVKDYLKACKDYSDNATKVSSTINSGNATTVGRAQIDAAKGIREKHKTLDDYLQKYKDVIDPQAYAQISQALTQSMIGVNEIAKHFGDVAAGIKNMTAEDYANAAKQTQWRIDRYAPLLEEYKELTKWEQDEKGNARIDYIRGIHGDVSEFEKELEDLRFQQYSYENLAKYADLSKNADFAEKSVYQGDGSVLQDRVNNPEKSKLMDNAHTIAQYVPLEPTTHTYALIQQLWNYENTHLMTEDEVKNFNYLYNTQGKTAAKEYMDYLQYALNKRSQENTSAKVAELTSAIPGLSQTLASLVSTPLTLAGGSGILDAGAQKLIKGVTGDDTPVDYNRDAMFASNISNTIRGTVAKDISESIGGGWGEAASTAYQLGMSMQDSAAIAAMATINPVLGTVGTALLSGSAATTTMKQAAENGATDGQALTVGLLAGAWEFIFEKYELDNIIGGGKNIFLSLLKSSLSEATGEAATEIANMATDVWILAENSNWEKNVQAYMLQYLQENPDATDEEAEQWANEKAFKDSGMEVIKAFGYGLLTGGMMGGSMHMLQSNMSNQKTGNQIMGNPGGAVALKQAALDTGAELGGRQQKQLERLAGKVSDEIASGTGFKGIAANVRNAVNAQRVGKLYNKTVQGNSRLNVADMKARLQEEGYSEKEAASIAEAVDDAMWGRDLRDMLGREAADRQSDLLESVMQDPRYQRAIESALLNKDSQTMNRFMRPEQAFMKHDTQKESSVPATEMAAPAVSVSQEGTGTPEVVQAPVSTQTVAEPMDYGEVYSAVESARENGALDNARYEQLMDSLQNAVVDLEAGRIDEATYNGILQSAAEQANMGSRVISQGEHAARNQDLQVSVDDETWQQGQKLAKVLRRDIVFYNGRRGENGRHVNGTIYVNVNSDMPLMQVVCHELTHSLEGTKAYKQLLNYVIRQYRRSGYDIARVRAAKVALYKRYDVSLKTQAEVDQEIVAEYMEKHLLADEQSILDLVREEPNVAKRILSWIKGMWKRLTAAGDAKTIAQMEWAQRIYSKALSQSLKALPNEGQVTTGKSPAQVKADDIRQGRQQVSDAYRRGELTDEQHDAAMDEYDRVEEDQLGALVGEYSFDDIAIDTSHNDVMNSVEDAQFSFSNNNNSANGYSGVSLTDNSRIYTYDFLVSQPDMNIVVLPDLDTIRGDDARIDTAQVVKEGMKNALSVGQERAGKIYVANRYTDRDLRIDVSSIRHGLNGGMNRIITNARLGCVIGDVVQNAIPINALHNTSDMAIGTYAMAGYAVDEQGREIIAIITVEQRSNSVAGVDAFDVTHAVSGRQNRGKLVDTKSQGVYPSKLASTISIKDLLLSVKSTYRSILPNDVLENLGESRNEDGYYAGKVKFSFSNDVVEEDQRTGQGWYDTDEKQLQAKKKGYPVLHGEQVVPFNTWVQTKDRGNYGLVTGLAPGNKLLVNFHNKHEDASAEVAIPYGNLVPVPGAYQMTKEEFDSLMASEPLDVSSMELTEADQEALEEMYRRSGGEKSDMPTVDIEKMPRKAKDYLRRAENRLLRDLANRLGVSKFVDRTYLKEIVDEIANAYLTEGTVSNELISGLFDKAYDQGVIVDKSFYEQYKHIKDVLRTTAVTLSEQDRADIADFSDFRKRQFNRLRIVDKGGTPVNQFYEELHDMAPELFPESITHPADQLVQMSEVSRSVAASERLLSEYYGKDAQMYRSWARNEFDSLVSQTMGDLFAIRRFAAEKASRGAKEKAPTTPQEAMEVYKKLKNSRRVYERATARNLLTDHDEMMVGRLLRHEMELSHLDPERDNVKGITEVFEAKRESEEYCRLIRDYKKQLNKNRQSQADRYLETAQLWKDKKMGIAYSRETMRRNIYDIVPDKNLAREINEAFFEPVHDSEADATRMKNRYRKRVESLGLSRKVAKGNLVSEAHAVQLLGEAEDNIRMLENAKGRMQQRDGKTLAEWHGVVLELWKSNPNLDEARIRNGVAEFRKIYDELFEQMNLVRVENGYEPISYRSGYFPHFQPDQADGILAQFGRALGIETQVVQLPTTISGLTHTFKPGIQWFGNAMERLGFNTAYDAVEGFDKYIEGAASVIHQTANIQNLRALATQIRYRTSQEGIQEQVDAVREDDRLSEDEKQIKIKDILEHGKYKLANFVAELDEYTNLLANKKSKYDRGVEAMMGRRMYTFMKWWESRTAANMIAGNINSALTNFIPLVQAAPQLNPKAMLRGVWDTLKSIRTDDGLRDMSAFLTNRKGSDPLIRTVAEHISAGMAKPMDFIDGLVSGSVVRAAYYHNLKRGMSEAEAMHQADIFAAGVIADRSKGSTPTLFQATNPVVKLFTQFQLEVNNQFSEVFKDIPRRYRDESILKLGWVLFAYFFGSLVFNDLFEFFFGRRPALDPFGLLIDVGRDFIDPDVSFGEGAGKFVKNAAGQLPFSSALSLVGFETDGGRVPVSSSVPDLTAIAKAATAKKWDPEEGTGMHWKKRLQEIGDEVYKPAAYVLSPFGGNQTTKIWKGVAALIQGGSYSVDNSGEGVLQYNVNSDPFSVLRAAILGKSSLPQAQEWVESGFDSLSAKETAVYQDMIDVGTSGDDAYRFIQELGKAKETEGLTKDAVRRQMIRDADISGDAKAIAYYGLLAKHDEEQKSMTEREIMDGLAEMGADAWEVTKVLMASKDANKLEGIDEGIAKRNAITESALTHEEKVFMYRELVSEGRSEDIDIFRDAGLEFDQFVKIHNQYVRINDMDASASIKATLLARWVDGQDYTPAQKQLVKDEFAYYSMVPATAVKYDKFVAAGMDYDQAVELIGDLTALEPAEDEIQVKDIQRWRTCVDFSGSAAMQLAALRGSMTDSQYAKVDAAYQNSVSPEMYVTFRETLPKYDADGNGSLNGKEVEKAVRSMSGLSNSQKAVLWQLAVNSKSAKNNPFSTSVGERILKALEKE